MLCSELPWHLSLHFSRGVDALAPAIRAKEIPYKILPFIIVCLFDKAIVSVFVLRCLDSA